MKQDMQHLNIWQILLKQTLLPIARFDSHTQTTPSGHGVALAAWRFAVAIFDVGYGRRFALQKIDGVRAIREENVKFFHHARHLALELRARLPLRLSQVLALALYKIFVALAMFQPSASNDVDYAGASRRDHMMACWFFLWPNETKKKKRLSGVVPWV